MPKLDEAATFSKAILEGWKQGLRNCWWIIDDNPAEPEAVVAKGILGALRGRAVQRLRLDVVILKYGSLFTPTRRNVPRESWRSEVAQMGRQLSQPALLGARCSQGGAAWRRRLSTRSAIKATWTQLIEARSGRGTRRLDNMPVTIRPRLLDAFGKVIKTGRLCFICYTIKGSAPLPAKRTTTPG